jgi:hypothetical protein
MSTALQSLVGSRGVAYVMVLSIAFGTWTALSDDVPVSERPTQISVATIDSAKVFKHANEFNRQMSRLKEEIDEVDRQLSRKAMDESQAAAKRQVFLKRESTIYADTYASVEKIVARISKGKNIRVVLRIETSPLDPSDRNSVLRGLNRPIVYFAAPDLTDDVIAEVNHQ